MSPRSLHLYPKAWRARYGDDMADALSRTSLRPGEMVDILRGAWDARLHPALVQSEGSALTFERPRRRALLKAAVLPLLVVAVVVVTASSAATAGGSKLMMSSLPNVPMVGTPPALPARTASLATWDAFAKAQTKWIESQPYQAAYAAQGRKVLQIHFIPVLDTPGAPKGVTTMAVAIEAGPPGSAAP